MKYRLSLAILIVAALMSGRTKADPMTLTPAGATDGFSLTTFADNFPDTSSCCSGGPVGMAFTSSGVLVSDYPAGSVLAFPSDTNGQSASSVPQVQGYGNPAGIAELNGNLYMAQEVPAGLVQINSDGTFKQNVVSLPGPRAVLADVLTNKLFVSNSSGIYIVDPVAKTVSLFVSGNYDGLTLSPDGSTLYAAEYSVAIQGFSTATGKQVFLSGSIPGIDGTALGFGNLSGDIFGNTNYGQVVEVNLSTGAQTVIGTGGSRGDFVTVDPNNGSLLLTQSDSILRLTPSGGGSFNPNPVPEPATWILLASGLIGIGLFGRRLVHN